jgi:hypothetical protein
MAEELGRAAEVVVLAEQALATFRRPIAGRLNQSHARRCSAPPTKTEAETRRVEEALHRIDHGILA